jgi:hypothetical protein
MLFRGENGGSSEDLVQSVLPGSGQSGFLKLLLNHFSVSRQGSLVIEGPSFFLSESRKRTGHQKPPCPSHFANFHRAARQPEPQAAVLLPAQEKGDASLEAVFR